MVTILKQLNFSKSDTAPTIECDLWSAKLGTPITNISSVKFKMNDSDGTNVIDDDATIVSAPDGRVSYAFTASQTATAGTFYAKFIVTLSTGGVLSLPTIDGIKIVIDEF